jgi:hypothetical protein
LIGENSFRAGGSLRRGKGLAKTLPVRSRRCSAAGRDPLSRGATGVLPAPGFSPATSLFVIAFRDAGFRIAFI